MLMTVSPGVTRSQIPRRFGLDAATLGQLLIAAEQQEFYVRFCFRGQTVAFIHAAPILSRSGG